PRHHPVGRAGASCHPVPFPTMIDRQRPPGEGHRGGDRGEVAQGRCPAGPPGGRARRALGPPRLPRPRHPYSARRRAHLLRAGAALEGLPADSADGAGGGRDPWRGRFRRHGASLTVTQVPGSPGGAATSGAAAPAEAPRYLDQSIRLVLWRHGQTRWNVEGRFQGQSDIPLDAVGEQQAERAARLLAGLRPDAIVSSDLSRAMATAAPLARLAGLTVTIDKDLRERFGGLWEGLTDAEIRARFPDEHAAWLPPEGEASAVVDDRAGAALGRMAGGLGPAGRARRGTSSPLAWPPGRWWSWSATVRRSAWARPGCWASPRSCGGPSGRSPIAHGRSWAGAGAAGGCWSTTRGRCPSRCSATTADGGYWFGRGEGGWLRPAGLVVLYTGVAPSAGQPWWRRGYSSVGRALAWHARGPGFESP